MRLIAIEDEERTIRIWLAPSAFFPHRGGVEELTLQLARRLGEQGHHTLVVAPRHPVDLPATDDVEGVDVARINFTAPRAHPVAALRAIGSLALSLASLWRLRRRVRPDVVHVQCPSVQLFPVALFCWLVRVPLIVTSQGETQMDAHQIYQHSAFLRWALRWSSGRAAALTACSSWTAAAAAEIAPRFSEAEIVLNGIDPAQWTVTDPAPEPVVCAWGRHVPQKGLDLLVDAFPLVQEQVPGARLVIGGDGPETDQLAARAGAGVTFVGSLDRNGVAELLSSSRVAVVPSRLEPFGIVALEAMAAGRSVVWSTVGGLREATRGTGRGVDPTDAHELAQAVVDLLREPEDPRVLRARAEECSWQRIAQQYLLTYERARGSGVRN